MRAIVVLASLGLRNYGGKVAIRSSHGKSRACKFAVSDAILPPPSQPPRPTHGKYRGITAIRLSLPRFDVHSTPRTRHPRQDQGGAIALVLMLMIGVLVGLLVISFARSVQGNNVADTRTVLAMANAREALLGYATTYRDTHSDEVFGYLPCPDLGTGTEGQAASACGGTDVTVIGRLPWKTLDVGPLRDASGECLWYAVSGDYKNNPKTGDLLNPDTNGLIEVMAADGSGFIAGASPTQRAVAVIFAPGAILPGQDRSLATTNPPTICGGNYNAANYLDTDTFNSIDNATPSNVANALTQFIAAQHSDLTPASTDAFNDQLMVIFSDDVFARHVALRTDFEGYLTDPLTGLLRTSADCLANYSRTNVPVPPPSPPSPDPGLKYLPWAAPLNVSPFGTASNYVDSTGTLSGRLPQTVAISAPTTNNNGGSLLLDASRCPGWSNVDEFWEAWKDHLFYAVARAHRPDSAVASNNDPCSGDECIDVIDAGGTKRTNMAAVVIFSGARLPGQNRNNDINPSYDSTDKAIPANYLEAPNDAEIQTNPPPGATNRLFSKIAGNDTIMCLRYASVGSGTEVYVDPTCGASANCVSDGLLLAAYRTGATNHCRVGTSGIKADCATRARNIDINNCPGDPSTLDANGQPYSCERAARDFVSDECLQGFTTAKCQLAHTALTNCQ